MRWFSYVPLTLCIVFLPASTAPAQSELPGLIDRAVRAYGGEAQLAKMRARHNKCEGTLTVANGVQVPFSQEVYFQAPSQIKEIMSAEVNGAKQTVVSILNGDKGAMHANGQLHELSAAMLAELKEGVHFAQVTRFTALKERFFILRALPEGVVNSKPALGIRVSAEGYRDIDLYLDKDTFLLAKTVRTARDFRTNELMKEELYYSGWKVIDGIATPMKLTVYRDGKKFMDVDAKEVSFSEKFDDSVFTNP